MVDAINSFVDQLLGVGNDAQVILKAVEAEIRLMRWSMLKLPPFIYLLVALLP
ncbi:MAG: hypothetical protein V7K89_15045 [Nostoc sp.]|uniref:hypothetical protein n=1 Tax=Nostoc sp. TaxID=1180 RepID=UPI002FF61BCC